MTNRVVVACVSLMFVLGSVRPGFASQRRHHPWFSHAKQNVPAEATETLVEAPRPPIVTPAPAVVRSASKNEAVSFNDRAGEQVAQQALAYKGTRYKYGGTSKRGMDCSGLVARVWEDLKLKKVPRMSASLYTSGQAVHLGELKPGDLVFFKNTSKSGISHVGVYAGNNKFVHAAGRRKGVTITKLSDPYYQLHYAGARRLY